MFIDGHRTEFNLDQLVSPCDDTSDHGVEWADMLTAVLAAAT